MILIGFNSCDKKGVVEKGIIGEYAIIFLNYNDTNLLYNLTLNIIEFHKDGNVVLPGIVDRQHNGLKVDRCLKGSWKLHQKDKMFFVDIITDNLYFNGTYEVSFDENKKDKLLQIILMNERFVLAGEKSYFNYRQNESLVKDLIKYTNDSIVSQ